MNGYSAVHDHSEFLFNIATSSEDEYKKLLKAAPALQVTVAVECLVNSDQFLDKISKSDQRKVEKIASEYAVQEDINILIKNRKLVQKVLARILTVVWKTEVWRVMLNHG